MKKTMLSLAAASLVFGASAYADVDFNVGGQAKIYYETNEADGAPDDMKLFDQKASKAVVGLQFNAAADLGNGFGFGSQATFMDTWGLQKNLVADVPQDEDGQTISNMITLTKLYLTKKVANTTVKAGRQELPKSLSPLAFSEGWNVFKNTFDAIVAINTDIPDTTLVGAYVSASNYSFQGAAVSADLGTFDDLAATTTAGKAGITKGAYMLTAANKSIPMTALTASYYHLSGVAVANSADAVWVDAAIAGDELPAGLTIGLQGGSIMPDASGLKDTAAFGVKLGAKIENFTVGAAYTSVDDGTVALRNVGTGIKTPLYTQMIFNQFYIGHDANTWQLSAGAGFGDYGNLNVQYASADMGSNAIVGADETRTELDVVYKIKAGGVQYFAAYVNNDNDKAANNDKVRVLASYAF